MRILKWLRSLGIRLWFTAQMAGHGILSNPMRTALTILGIAIGVASVVSLMGIGEGARLAVMRQFQSLGTNVVVMKAVDPSVEFKPKEAAELVERVSGLEMATPVIHAEAIMRWRRERGNGEILGVNNYFPQIRDHAPVSGHFFTALHVAQRSPVAVLGYNVGNKLMRGRSPVGQIIKLEGLEFRILGVLSQKGTGQGDGIDDKILIPYTTAQKIAKKKTAEEIWGKAKSAREADLAVVQMGRIMRRKLGLDQNAPTPVSTDNGNKPEGMGMEMPGMGFMGEEAGGGTSGNSALSKGKDLITITNLNQLVKEADKANRVMTLLLGGIAAVSLLVGGLGIMNIMLVAVTERTGEIGVRRALGAKQTDLIVQFLLEAVYLSIIGTVVGVSVGIWGLNLFANYGFETAISIDAIKVASIVALGSGLLFGVYPAISASSVPPVEALRR